MRFIFVMNHSPIPEQMIAAKEGGRQVVELGDKKLLLVPEDANLGRDWFVSRAEAIVASVGGIEQGDTLHVMGQQQLVLAVSAIGRRVGATLIESVTPRDSKEVRQSDGSVKKENVFTFSGFRTVHEY